MSIFAIADTHLSFGTDKPMNVFSGWSDHILRLKNNWERLVEPDDTVVIAGDISWEMNLDEALDDFKFLQSLPGKKIIMKGNHDYCGHRGLKWKAFSPQTDWTRFLFCTTMQSPVRAWLFVGRAAGFLTLRRMTECCCASA